MMANAAEFESLLANLRREFLGELAERCDRFDQMILALQESPQDADIFNELYRAAHSLKGLGGTHGLGVITAICHQLESLLTESRDRGIFGERFTSTGLAYVDLLRRVQHAGDSRVPEFGPIERDLEALRQRELESRKAGLIAESSAMMAQYYQQALQGLPLQLAVEPNGLAALELLLREPFDFVIVARELRELNGVALISALRHSRAANQGIPAILVTSNRDAVPVHAGFTAVIARDQNLPAALVSGLGALFDVA